MSLCELCCFVCVCFKRRRICWREKTSGKSPAVVSTVFLFTAAGKSKYLSWQLKSQTSRNRNQMESLTSCVWSNWTRCSEHVAPSRTYSSNSSLIVWNHISVSVSAERTRSVPGSDVREKKIKRWRWWGRWRWWWRWRWRWRWWQLFSSSADSKWTRSRSCGGTRSWWREGKYIIIIIINTDNRQNITHVLHCWYQNNSRRIYLSLCRSFSFTSWLLPVCGGWSRHAVLSWW